MIVQMESLFMSLLEASMPNGFGFEVQTDSSIRKDAFLFGEAQSRVVVSVAKEKKDKFEKQASGIACLFAWRSKREISIG